VLGLNLVLKRGLCSKHHWYYGHARPRQQFIIVSISRRVTGNFHSPLLLEVWNCPEPPA